MVQWGRRSLAAALESRTRLPPSASMRNSRHLPSRLEANTISPGSLPLRLAQGLALLGAGGQGLAQGLGRTGAGQTGGPQQPGQQQGRDGSRLVCPKARAHGRLHLEVIWM